MVSGAAAPAKKYESLANAATRPISNIFIDGTALMSGAVVMTLELAAVRVLAPQLGSSLTVWTALIGALLMCLSAGAYLGGRLSVEVKSRAWLSLLMVATALLVLVVVTAGPNIVALCATIFPNLALAAIVSTLALFGGPALLLGMVPPLLGEALALEVSRTGAVVGRLSALATVGSVLGTFISGLVLIPLVGSQALIYGCGLVLILNGLLLERSRHVWFKLAALVIYGMVGFLVFGQAATASTVHIDTAYAHYMIETRTDKDSGRPVRVLKADPWFLQSAVYLDNRHAQAMDPFAKLHGRLAQIGDELVQAYTRYFRLHEYFVPQAQRFLIIGGGALVYPGFLAKRQPEAAVDVAEIDSALLPMALEYFEYQANPRVRFHAQDGRSFINRSGDKYDVIILDAYGAVQSIPFELATREAFEKMRGILADRGVLLVNVLGSQSGPGSDLVRAIGTTLTTVFPKVRAFAVDAPNLSAGVHNFIFAASVNSYSADESALDSELTRYLGYEVKSLASGMVLSDDYAPTDWLGAKVVVTARAVQH